MAEWKYAVYLDISRCGVTGLKLDIDRIPVDVCNENTYIDRLPGTDELAAVHCDPPWGCSHVDGVSADYSQKCITYYYDHMFRGPDVDQDAFVIQVVNALRSAGWRETDQYEKYIQQ